MKDRECLACKHFYEDCQKPREICDYGENNHKCLNFEPEKEKEQ